MHKELPCRLRYVQVVLKEGIDRGQNLVIKFNHRIAAKNLLDKHSTQARRKLVDQSADPELVVGDHSLTCIEDPAHIHRHLGFLVGTGQILEFVDDRTIGAAHLDHRFHVQHVDSRLGDFLQRIVPILLFQRLDQDHTVLVNFRQIIAVLNGKEARQHFRCDRLRLRFDLKDHDRSAHAVRNMKFLGTIVNIHKKQVVE